MRVHSLHSRVPWAAQQEALRPVAAGEWRVLLATNVAESSLTLPGVTAVVDSGRERTLSWVPEVTHAPSTHHIHTVMTTRGTNACTPVGGTRLETG